MKNKKNWRMLAIYIVTIILFSLNIFAETAIGRLLTATALIVIVFLIGSAVGMILNQTKAHRNE